MLQLLLTVIAIVCVVSSVFANDEQACFQGREPRLRIKGCSDIIQRSPDDATAYQNRAFAYELTGDIDKAIADYSKAIVLAPSNASAYVNRGRAYASKGDQIHAAEDDTKAHELIAKSTTPPPPVITRKVRMRVAAASTKSTMVRPKKKRIPKASNRVGQEALSADPWAWLWGNDAGKTRGRANLKKRTGG
jgi:tetratricopeptide (TPR) repeat protein